MWGAGVPDVRATALHGGYRSKLAWQPESRVVSASAEGEIRSQALTRDGFMIAAMESEGAIRSSS